MAVLPNLQQQLDQAMAVIAKQQELLEAAQKRSERKITMKVTAPKLDDKTGQMTGTSGAISLYGLGRFPITLYRSQWERLISEVPTLQAFIADNAALLAAKA